MTPGMLRTTMHDLSAFVNVLMNTGRVGDVQVIRPKVVELMLGRQGMVNVPSRSFKFIDRGLGWNIVDVEGSPLYTMNGFSGGIFTDVYFSPQEKGAILYYFTGINMKNMAAVPGITRTLHTALREFK